jgi:hypothetical protein
MLSEALQFYFRVDFRVDDNQGTSLEVKDLLFRNMTTLGYHLLSSFHEPAEREREREIEID